MKTLTANAQAKVDQNLATEPLILIKIEWTTGTVYYADKAVTITPIVAKGAIIDMSDVLGQVKVQGGGDFTSVSILLDDTDGTLKTLVNTEIIEGTTATAYLHYEGNAAADIVPLLKGRISGDVQWSEGDRTLSFSIETSAADDLAGFSTDATTLPTINKNSVSQAWPMVFGQPMRVPSLRLVYPPEGRTKDFIDVGDTTFKVEGGRDFPQSTSITIELSRYVRYIGSFSGEDFTATSINIAHYTNISLDSRKVFDPDVSNPKVFWIASDTAELYKHYVYMEHPEHGFLVNQVIGQHGRKIYCKQDWAVGNEYGQPATTILLNQFSTLRESAPFVRSSWTATFYITDTDERRHFRGQTTEVWQRWDVEPDEFTTEVGASVVQITGTGNVYIANLFSSSSVLEVSARRQYNNETILAPVPSSYYTVDLSDSVAGQTCTTITFPTPLTIRGDQQWDPQIYVTMASSVGPNAADVIKYLLENFSDLLPDATTFASVATKVTNYPTAFAITDDTQSTIDLCMSIAWQSRCALVVNSGIVYIVYLSEIPTENFTMTEAHIEHRQLMLSFSSIEEVSTKITSTWLSDYSGSEPNEVIYSNNIDKYGVHAREDNIFIYNREELVVITANFWGYRSSNIWRKISAKSFLKILALQVFDTVKFNVAIFSSNQIRSLIDSVSQDTDENSITINATVASKAGDSSGGEPIEDTDFYLGDPANPVVTNPGSNDPTVGVAPVNYIPPTGFQTLESDPTETDTATDKFIVVLIEPTESQPAIRGTDFAVRVELRDLQGRLLYETVVGAIALTSTDGADVLAPLSIDIVNGVYEDDHQITGGTDPKIGSLHVTASGYDARSVDPEFPIIDQLYTLSVIFGPDPYIRSTNFTVNITSGAPNSTLDVTKNLTDGSDILSNGAGQITQITLDGSGEYTATDWFFSGGTGVDTGNTIIFSDVLGVTKHNPFTTASFTIQDTAGSLENIVNENVNFNDSGGSSQPLVPYFVISTSGGGNHARSTSYNLTVTAYKADGTIDTSYVPAGSINLTLTDKSDASDGATPTTIPNTGWSSGAKTITNFEIAGGSGTDTATIVVTDPADGRTGSLGTTIEGTANSYTASSTDSAFGNSSYTNGGLADGTPTALAQWAGIQASSLAAAEASSFISSGDAGVQIYDFLVPAVYSSSHTLSRLTFSLPSAARAAAVSAQIRLSAGAGRFTGVGSPLIEYTLNIKFTESASSYATGAALYLATPDVSFTTTELRAQCGELVRTLGVGSTTPALGYFTIPLSVITAMTVDTQYAWVWWSPKSLVVPYDSTYAGSSTPTGHVVTFASPTDLTRIILQTP